MMLRLLIVVAVVQSGCANKGSTTTGIGDLADRSPQERSEIIRACYHESRAESHYKKLNSGGKPARHHVRAASRHWRLAARHWEEIAPGNSDCSKLFPPPKPEENPAAIAKIKKNADEIKKNADEIKKNTAAIRELQSATNPPTN